MIWNYKSVESYGLLHNKRKTECFNASTSASIDRIVTIMIITVMIHLTDLQIIFKTEKKKTFLSFHYALVHIPRCRTIIFCH